MSTSTPSEDGRSPILIAVVQEQDERPPQQAASILPSASVGNTTSDPSDAFNSNSSLLDRRGYSNVNIDIPLNTQSSLYMEVTHDGKVTELVARFESYAGCSDAVEESHDGHTSAPSPSGQPTTGSQAETVQDDRSEQPDHQSLRYSGSQPGSGHSPRKSIPSHWLPKSTGPNLATAQRAKERTHNKSADGNSPGGTRTVRGTRSSLDLGRACGREGTTYLTKEALATVDSTITSPSSPLGIGTVPSSPLKKAQNSPTRSPLRNSMTRQPRLSFKLSPTKSTHLNIESSPGHSRTPSSVATSTGSSAFYTAQCSPVRSPTDTEQSFHSAVEYLEDLDIPSLGLHADSDDHQVLHNSTGVPSVIKETKEEKSGFVKPKSTHDASSKLGFTQSHPGSYQQASRIPRIGTTSKIAAPIQNSTLKRAESVASLKYKLKMMQIMCTEADEASSSENPITASLDHGAVNNSKTTSVIGESSEKERESRNHDRGDSQLVPESILAQPLVATQQMNVLHIETITGQLGQPEISSEVPSLDEIPNGTMPSAGKASKHSSRTASASTVRETSKVTDPVPTDPAIIHSLKKTDVSGTALAGANRMPSVIIMMAYNFNIGNLNLRANQDDAASTTSDRVYGPEADTSPVRGRSEWYVPGSRRQRDSARSTHSSMGSDLRATAAEFFPQPASSVVPKEPFTAPEFVPQTITPTEPFTTTVDGMPFRDVSGLPEMTMLDRNGIPFLWYMYGVQFAYEQGFRNGRPKSPKKVRPKKQRSTLSSPTDATNPPSSGDSAVGSSSLAPGLTEGTRRLTSAELMPPPPLSAHRRQENHNPENARGSLQKQDSKVGNVETKQSFANQFDIIERTTLANRTNINASRSSNSVLPSGPRNMQLPTYHTIVRRDNRYRHPGNGLYGGRGNAAGIPMDATAPFPNPVAPQGRVGKAQVEGGASTDYSRYTIGREACGMIRIDEAMEKIGGLTCHACDPGH